MTDHDYRLEDQRDHKPNYTLRRVKTALASIAFVVSCTLLFVAERPASAPVEPHYSRKGTNDD